MVAKWILCCRDVQGQKKSSKSRENPQEPYDRGWAWMVALAVALWNALIAGTIKSFGVLYVEWLALYGQSPSTTAWTGALFTLSLMLGAPVSGCLSDRYSMRAARWLVVVGGLVTSSAMVATAWMPSLLGVLLTYGCIAGVASAAIDTPILNLLSQYFRKRRALANGVAFSGSSVGGLLLPPILALAIQEYSVRGAVMVLGALWLHLLVVAAIMRPLPRQGALVIELEVDGKGECPVEASEGCSTGSNEDINKDGLQVETECRGKGAHKENQEDATQNLTQNHPSMESQGSAQHVEEKSQGITTAAEETSQELETMVTKDKDQQKSGSALGNAVQDYVDFLRTPGLACVMLMGILASFSYYNLFFVVPPLAKELGMGKMAASRLISLASIVELFSRILVGYIADQLKARKYWILLASFSISLVVVLAVSSHPSPPVLIAYSVLFGLFAGVFAPLLIPMAVELVPPERMGSATGLFPFLTGLGMSLGPPILGAIYEETGSYVSCMWACALGYGAAILTVGLNLVWVRGCSCWTRQKTKSPRSGDV